MNNCARAMRSSGPRSTHASHGRRNQRMNQMKKRLRRLMGTALIAGTRSAALLTVLAGTGTESAFMAALSYICGAERLRQRGRVGESRAVGRPMAAIVDPPRRARPALRSRLGRRPACSELVEGRDDALREACRAAHGPHCGVVEAGTARPTIPGSAEGRPVPSLSRGGMTLFAK